MKWLEKILMIKPLITNGNKIKNKEFNHKLKLDE